MSRLHPGEIRAWLRGTSGGLVPLALFVGAGAGAGAIVFRPRRAKRGRRRGRDASATVSHAPEQLIAVLVALLIFGPNRLPGIGSALGKALKEFRHGLRDEGTHETEDM